jgi:hypothetical protein
MREQGSLESYAEKDGKIDQKLRDQPLSNSLLLIDDLKCTKGENKKQQELLEELQSEFDKNSTLDRAVGRLDRSGYPVFITTNHYKMIKEEYPALADRVEWYAIDQYTPELFEGVTSGAIAQALKSFEEGIKNEELSKVVGQDKISSVSKDVDIAHRKAALTSTKEFLDENKDIIREHISVILKGDSEKSSRFIEDKMKVIVDWLYVNFYENKVETNTDFPEKNELKAVIRSNLSFESASPEKRSSSSTEIASHVTEEHTRKPSSMLDV